MSSDSQLQSLLVQQHTTGISIGIGKMKKRIHVNQHKIRSNSKTGDREPVITVKTYKSNTYCSEVFVNGPCKIVYSPDKPLPCGAKVWIETESEIICNKEEEDET